MQKIYCRECGKEVLKQKYCIECGAFLGTDNCEEDIKDSSNLSDEDVADSLGGKKISEPIFEAELESKMLVDYCRKTIATAIGDGHEEIVLGYLEEEDSYILDVYVKIVGSKKESHKMYRTTKQAYIDACKYIEDNKLLSYENTKGAAICGGDYVLKFIKADGSYCRLSTSNDISIGLIIGMGNLLSSYVNKE